MFTVGLLMRGFGAGCRKDLAHQSPAQPTVYVFSSFSEQWAARRGPAKLSVLDFNRVFADFKRTFEADLRSGGPAIPKL